MITGELINYRSTAAAAEDYELQFEQRDEYLYFRAHGKNASYFIFRRILCDIAEKSTQFGCRRVLLENKLEADLTAADVYYLVTDLPAIGFLSKRLAIVRERSDDMDTHYFANTVAENRSIPMRKFGWIRPAEIWLLE